MDCNEYGDAEINGFDKNIRLSGPCSGARTLYEKFSRLTMRSTGLRLAFGLREICAPLAD